MCLQSINSARNSTVENQQACFIGSLNFGSISQNRFSAFKQMGFSTVTQSDLEVRVIFHIDPILLHFQSDYTHAIFLMKRQLYVTIIAIKTNPRGRQYLNFKVSNARSNDEIKSK